MLAVMLHCGKAHLHIRGAARNTFSQNRRFGAAKHLRQGAS